MTVTKKRTSPIAHSLKMLENRWIEPDASLVAASALAPVWVRMRGVEAPVKFGEPLTMAKVQSLGITAWAPLAHTDELSEREFKVFCDLASGLTVSEIAKKQFLSVKTVSTYRARIIEKTGLRNNAEIAVYAAQVGIVHWREIKSPTTSGAAATMAATQTNAAAQP